MVKAQEEAVLMSQMKISYLRLFLYETVKKTEEVVWLGEGRMPGTLPPRTHVLSQGSRKEASRVYTDI